MIESGIEFLLNKENEIYEMLHYIYIYSRGLYQ